MQRMDIGRAFEPAFRYMADMLFRPFMLRMWLALGFTFTVGYGLSSSTATPNPARFWRWNRTEGLWWAGRMASWLAHYWPLLLTGLLALVAIGLVFVWLSSVFQFVYIDNITRKSGAVAEPFARLMRLGGLYFLWRMAFGAVVLVAVGILAGLPLLVVFVPATSVATKVAAAVWAGMIGILLSILAAIIQILAKDFLVPAMYVRQAGVIEGWRTVLPALTANVGQTLLYLLMLAALGIGITAVGLIAALVLLVALAIPVGLLALLGYVAGQAAHLTWSPPVIGMAGALGLIVLLGYTYLFQCVMQPAYVFRRCFSLVVLGQADPSLATIPLETPPTTPPEQA
ncbi:MAG TPA: hypothetical protein VMX94_11615 [Armatimonadota bacterium]|nr:hypothetical protein [Armatimonadota bacterium]